MAENNETLKSSQKCAKSNRKNRNFRNEGRLGLKKVDSFPNVKSMMMWIPWKAAQALVEANDEFSVEFIPLLMGFQMFLCWLSPKWLRILGERERDRSMKSALFV